MLSRGSLRLTRLSEAEISLPGVVIWTGARFGWSILALKTNFARFEMKFALNSL